MGKVDLVDGLRQAAQLWRDSARRLEGTAGALEQFADRLDRLTDGGPAITEVEEPLLAALRTMFGVILRHHAGYQTVEDEIVVLCSMAVSDEAPKGEA